MIKNKRAQNASVTDSTEYTIKCKSKLKKAVKKYNKTRKYSSSHQPEQTNSPLSMRGPANH